MTYRARNRRLCDPPIPAFIAGGHQWFVDDANETPAGKVEPFSWGREGTVIRVTTHHTGRFTLVDERGRFLKHARCYAGEGKRRTRTFRSKVAAAIAQQVERIETCE